MEVPINQFIGTSLLVMQYRITDKMVSTIVLKYLAYTNKNRSRDAARSCESRKNIPALELELAKKNYENIEIAKNLTKANLSKKIRIVF